MRIAGVGLTVFFGGGGSWSRGTRGEDRVFPCAKRAPLLLVAAEEARVRTHWEINYRKIIGIYRNDSDKFR